MGFETDFTREFVRRSLPVGARRVLEVGCGSGVLAASLSLDGLTMVAIDSHFDSILAAQRLGLDARVATWPDFDGGRFDAVLFTRSLHHIHPLDQAVLRAAQSLLENGRMIVEDFAYESIDEKTLRWFVSVIDALERAGSVAGNDEFLNALRIQTESLTAWRENHERDLHPAANIFARMTEVFDHVTHETAPYFFRYLAKVTIPIAKRDMILREVAEWEAALISEGTIVALGRRFVAE